MNRPPAPRQAPESTSDWTLAELGRSVVHLTGAVTSLTDTLAALGRTVTEHGARLRTMERFAYTTVGCAISVAVGALTSGRVHWG